MSVEMLSLLILVAFISAIAIAFVKKSNVGILAMFFSVILAVISGTSIATLINGFPTRTFVTVMAVTMFFGSFMANGTTKWLADVILYKLRNAQKLLPFAFFFISVIAGIVGGGGAPLVMATICMPIGLAAGIHPVHTALIVVMGANNGCMVEFGYFGSVVTSLISSAPDGVYASGAKAITWATFFAYLLANSILQVVLYFSFKSYKLGGKADVKEPAPLSPIHKKSSIMITISVVALLFPVMMNTFFGGFWARVAAYADVTAICFLGCTINSWIGVSDEQGAIKAVPWNALVIIGGTGMMLGLARTVGALGVLVNMVTNIPPGLVPMAICIIAGVMSLFTSSLSVVFPTLIPIALSISAATDINPAWLIASITCGTLTAAISPISTGGSMAYSCVTPEMNDVNKQFNGQLLGAILMVVGMGILSWLGVMNIFKF